MLSPLFLVFCWLWFWFSLGILRKEINKESSERIFVGFIFCFTMSILFTGLLFLMVSCLAFYEGYLEPNYEPSNIKFIQKRWFMIFIIVSINYNHSSFWGNFHSNELFFHFPQQQGSLNAIIPINNYLKQILLSQCNYLEESFITQLTSSHCSMSLSF